MHDLDMSVEVGKGNDIELIIGFDQLEQTNEMLVLAGQPFEKYRLTAAESILFNEAIQLGEKIELTSHEIHVNGSQKLIRNKNWKCSNFGQVRDRLIEIYGPVQAKSTQKFSRKRYKPDAEVSRRSVKCRNRLCRS